VPYVPTARENGIYSLILLPTHVESLRDLQVMLLVGAGL